MDTICCNSHSLIRNAIDAAAYRSAKRTAAAMKGWRTRRANLSVGLMPAYEPPTVRTITFGGTLPSSPTTTVKEVERQAVNA